MRPSSGHTDASRRGHSQGQTRWKDGGRNKQPSPSLGDFLCRGGLFFVLLRMCYLNFIFFRLVVLSLTSLSWMGKRTKRPGFSTRSGSGFRLPSISFRRMSDTSMHPLNSFSSPSAVWVSGREKRGLCKIFEKTRIHALMACGWFRVACASHYLRLLLLSRA